MISGTMLAVAWLALSSCNTVVVGPEKPLTITAVAMDDTGQPCDDHLREMNLYRSTNRDVWTETKGCSGEGCAEQLEKRHRYDKTWQWWCPSKVLAHNEVPTADEVTAADMQFVDVRPIPTENGLDAEGNPIPLVFRNIDQADMIEDTPYWFRVGVVDGAQNVGPLSLPAKHPTDGEEAVVDRTAPGAPISPDVETE